MVLDGVVLSTFGGVLSTFGVVLSTCGMVLSTFWVALSTFGVVQYELGPRPQAEAVEEERESPRGPGLASAVDTQQAASVSELQWATAIADGRFSLAARVADGAQSDSSLEIGPCQSVFLLMFNRVPKGMLDLLAAGRMLRFCSEALEAHGHSWRLLSGAAVFVHPPQYPAVMRALVGRELLPSHVVVAGYLEHVLEETLVGIGKGCWARARDGLPLPRSRGSSEATGSNSAVPTTPPRRRVNRRAASAATAAAPAADSRSFSGRQPPLATAGGLILKTSSQGSSAPQRNPGIVRGNLVDVRTFQLFEGSTRLHKATCAEGERYSLVIFSICDKGDFAAHGRNARGTAGAFFLKVVDVAEKADPSGFILAREERTRLLVRTQRLSDLLRARRMILIKMYRADLWIA